MSHREFYPTERWSVAFPFLEPPYPCCAAAFGGGCRALSAKGFPPPYVVETNMQIGRCKEYRRASESSHMVYLYRLTTFLPSPANVTTSAAHHNCRGWHGVMYVDVCCILPGGYGPRGVGVPCSWLQGGSRASNGTVVVTIKYQDLTKRTLNSRKLTRKSI